MNADYGRDGNNVFSFINQWNDILHRFSREQCRCEKVYQGQRCQNYLNLHSDGHQFTVNKYKTADRFRRGDFESGFPKHIGYLQRTFKQSLESSHVLRARSVTYWSKKLQKEASISGVNGLFSNRTCFACLSRIPIHVIPCGHSICDSCALDECARGGGDETALLLRYCPFGCTWPAGRSFQVRRKPADAGIRILSLDGYVLP